MMSLKRLRSSLQNGMSSFGGRRLEIVHVVRLFLESHQLGAHVVEKLERKGVTGRRRDVFGVVREVANHLVHAVDADRREVIAQRAEIALRVREEPLIDMALDDLALDFKARLREFKEVVETRVEPRLVTLKEVPETRAVHRHDAERARLLGRAEKPVAALEELAQVQLEAAAHRADHVRVQVGVNEVLEVGQAVLRRHVEEGVDVLASQSKSGVML